MVSCFISGQQQTVLIIQVKSELTCFIVGQPALNPAAVVKLGQVANWAANKYKHLKSKAF